MKPTCDGWAWINMPANDVAALNEGGDDTDDAVAKAFARCFAGADGQRVLAHLRRQTLDRAVGPAASDATLRHLEGQRQLVVHILALTARGTAAD